MAKYDVVAVGHALVDVICQVKEEFLDQQKLVKKAMTLVDEKRSAELYEAMKHEAKKTGAVIERMSGGSAGNTLSGIASLGGKAIFMGRVKEDELGHVFKDDMKKQGVEFVGHKTTTGPSSGCCLSFVTPDAERTMQTYLGAAAHVGPNDIDAKAIEQSSILYLEGYLWDPPEAKAAFLKASDLAHKADRLVALTLSDPFCVERHRNTFHDLIEHHVDILFANEEEIKALYQVGSFDDALQIVRDKCNMAALTRSAKGSVVLAGDEVHVIDACKPDKLVDTTGAGDLYAAGFLYGITHELPLKACGELANICAAEVISHMGARPLVRLDEYVAAKGFKKAG